MKKINFISALWVTIMIVALNTGCKTSVVQDPSTGQIHKLLDKEEPLGKWSACSACNGKGRCTTCKGSGKQNAKDCSACGGTGYCSSCNGEGGHRETK